MIVTDPAVAGLNTVLAPGIPVFVVAYFAARSAPDSFADLEEPPVLNVPDEWVKKGWRRRLVDVARPRWNGSDIAMDIDFQTRSDRNVAITAPSGLMASLFAIAFAGNGVGRFLTAASVVLFAFLVSSVMISATQANMLRLQLSKRGKERTDPFRGIVKAWVAAVAASVLSVVLAVLVVVS